MQSSSLTYRSAEDRWAAPPWETVNATALRSRRPKRNDSTIGQLWSCTDPESQSYEHSAERIDPLKLKTLMTVSAERTYASADDNDLWMLASQFLDLQTQSGAASYRPRRSSSWPPCDIPQPPALFAPALSSPLWFPDQGQHVYSGWAGHFPEFKEEPVPRTQCPRTHSAPPYGFDFPHSPVDIALSSFSAPGSPEPVSNPVPAYAHNYNWLWTPTHTAVPSPTASLNPFPVTATFRVNTQREDGRTRRQEPSCLFCRARKIACRRPPRGEGAVAEDGAAEGTCDQCLRRGRSPSQCVYPKESRRGHHSRIKSRLRRQAAAGAAGPSAA